MGLGGSTCVITRPRAPGQVVMIFGSVRIKGTIEIDRFDD